MAALRRHGRLLRLLLALLLAGALAAALVWGARWLAHRPAFAIEQVRIEGALTRNSADELRAAVLSRLSGNFFTLDLAELREEMESVPWIRHALVRRVWPDQLIISLEEHEPVAIWREQGLPERLLNRQGEVFEANIGEVDSLPELEGGRGQAPLLMAMYGKLMPRLAPLDSVPVRVSLSPRGAWQVELKRGELIALGRGTDEEVLQRLDRFTRAMQLGGARWQGWDRADLRHLNGFALHMAGAASTGPAVAQRAQ